MTRFLPLLLCLAGSAHAECSHVAGASFQVEHDQSILEINLFPMFADATRITYAACPVVADDNAGEVTDCSIAVTDRDGLLLSRGALGACTAADGWSVDCPDFTAEGFTAGNRAALDAMTASLDLSCPDTPDLRPLDQQITRGGDGLLETYRAHAFEVLSGCDALEGQAHALCAGLPGPHLSIFALEAVGRVSVCTMDDATSLSQCQSAPIMRD